MLDTTTSTSDLPLFGTMNSFSCGSDAIQIQRPLPTESYSWCDFPIAVQDDSPFPSYNSAAVTTNYHHHDNHNCGGGTQQQQHHPLSVSSSPTPSSSIRSSSFCSSPSESSMSSIGSYESETAEQEQQQQQQPQATTSGHKRRRSTVRFAASTHVRTYSLVLGDHPFCDDGLAIELGWEYNEGNINNENNHNKGSTSGSCRGETAPSGGRIGGSCQRRSYLSRKQLLLDVAGCTTEELEQRKRDLEAERISSQDYYYQQALAMMNR